MAQPHSGSNFPRDCTFVIEEAKYKNAYHESIFSCQKPAVVCLCI
jgi:hypothetical protein